jgi:hypothetical protein
MQALSQLSYSPRKEAHTIGIEFFSVNRIFENIYMDSRWFHGDCGG